MTEAKPDLDKVMDRIRKLLALSKSANEHEAARAAERAQALLARYNLDLADVEQRPAEVDVDDEFITDSYPWRRPLGSALAKLYFTRYFYSTLRKNKSAYDRHSFIGEGHNVIVAKLMFEYLTKTVDRLAREGAKKLPEPQRSPYRVSFRNACSLRLCVRIEKRIADAKVGQALDEETKTNLPALIDIYTKVDAQIDDWVEENMGSNALITKVVMPDARHAQGYRDGHEAGDEISLDQQIEDDKKRHEKKRQLGGPINHKFP